MFIVHPSNNSGSEQQQRNDFLFDSLLTNRINKKNLAPALMKFYTDVEQTGGSNEFYDKFSIRHHIQVILSSLWNDQHYRDQITNIGNTDPEFIRFVNMLINDTTFLLDEAISSLKRIHEIQEMKKSESEWNSKTAEQKEELDKEFSVQGKKNRRFKKTVIHETGWSQFFKVNGP